MIFQELNILSYDGEMKIRRFYDICDEGNKQFIVGDYCKTVGRDFFGRFSEMKFKDKLTLEYIITI